MALALKGQGYEAKKECNLPSEKTSTKAASPLYKEPSTKATSNASYIEQHLVEHTINLSTKT